MQNEIVIHPRLLGVFRIAFPKTIIPEGVSPREAWALIRPEGEFVHGSFWQIIDRKMMFAKTPEKQKAIAEYIYRKLESYRKNDRVWPPAVLRVNKQIFQPIPKI